MAKFAVALSVLFATYAHAQCTRASYCFAIDESTSVSSSSFAAGKVAVKAMASRLRSSAPGSRFAAVGYASGSQLVRSATTSRSVFDSAIDANTQKTGGTNINKALKQCRSALNRQPKPKVIVLVSNGANSAVPKALSKNLKKNGIKIAVMKVNMEPRDTSLNGIASPGNEESFSSWNAFKAGASGAADSLCGSVPAGKAICKVSKSCLPANVCYAVDESGSKNENQFQDQNGVIMATMSAIKMLTPETQFAVAGFSNQAETVSELTYDLGAVLRALLKNKQSSGGTSSGTGLKRCQKLMEDATGPKVIVLVTDGKDNRKPFGITNEGAIKKDGTTIVTVGIGKKVAIDDLTDIATADQLAKRDLFTKVPGYNAFSDAVGQIVRDVCRATVLYKKVVKVVPNCAEVMCMECGNKLNCYVDSKYPTLDRALCDAALKRSTFCSAAKGKQTLCGQTCKGRKPVVCYPTEWYAHKRNGNCKPQNRKNRKPKLWAPRNFGLYKMCNNGAKDTCLQQKCTSDKKKCWPVL